MVDKKIVADWFHKYHDDIFNFLIYYSGFTDVEDLVQEVFVKAIRHFHTYKENASPKTWLFSIARHVAIDELRKRIREKAKVNKAFQNKDFEQSNAINPEHLYGLSEVKAEIYQLIKEMNQSYRDVLILRGIKEFSVQETSEVLHWSVNKVNLTYHRALKALEKRIRRASF